MVSRYDISPRPTNRIITTGSLLAAVALTGVAIWAYRRFFASKDQPIFHLRLVDDRWTLEREGSSGTEGRFETKEEGVDTARDLAREAAPSELLIHRMDDSVQDRHEYAEPN